MSRFLPVLIAAAALLSFAPLAGADPPTKTSLDYFVSAPDLALSLPKERQRYTVEINRVASEPGMMALLKKAEAVYPRRETVLDAIKAPNPEAKTAPQTREPLWWYESFDGVRIPYALTAGAVAYYQKLIEAFQNSDYRGSHNIPMTSARLKYDASIKKYPTWTYKNQTFTDVYVADLTLNWNQYCGSLCAMGFEKKRLVVLGGDGAIRAVFGDGETNTPVS